MTFSLLFVIFGAIQDDSFRVDYVETVTVMRIPVLIQRDRRLVKGVQPQDVLLRENGVSLDVVDVTEIELPCTVHLLFDLSFSQSEHIRRARRIGSDLFRHLRKGDRVKIATFSGRYYGLTTYTDDLDSLRPVLDQLKPRGTTALYDGVYLALQELAAESGPRLLVVLSDGVDMTSRRREDELRTMVKSHGIPIVLVRFSKTELKGTQLIAQAESFRSIVKESGGTSYFADFSVSRSLNREIREFSTRVQVSYLPPNPEDVGQWRHIQINIADCDQCEIEYRRAYQLNKLTDSRN